MAQDPSCESIKWLRLDGLADVLWLGGIPIWSGPESVVIYVADFEGLSRGC